MKRKSIQVTLYIILLAVGKTLRAQDPHFSQYFASPMTVNPALIGSGVSSWRASAVYRAQWWGGYAEPYTTTSVSLEKSVVANSESKSNLAFGLSMVSDASNAGLLKNNYFSFGGAYHVALDAAGDARLSGGIMATYANRLLDGSKFLFQDQFGSMGFQRTRMSADPVNILSNKYWDVHAGLGFRKELTPNWGYDLGAAIYHAAKPSEGVYNNYSYSIDTRTTLQAGIHASFRNNHSLNGRFIWEKQGQHSIYTLGGLYGVSVNDETVKSLDLGLWHRFGDATYPYAGFSGSNWRAGISYDFVVSKIKTVNNSVQSLELSMTWLFGRKKEEGRSAITPF